MVKNKMTAVFMTICESRHPSIINNTTNDDDCIIKVNGDSVTEFPSGNDPKDDSNNDKNSLPKENNAKNGASIKDNKRS
jgi:hypothetical protein